MGIEAIIIRFGYLAIGIGTMLEGETILVLGGFAAHRGYLSLPVVALSGFLGSLVGDQLYFFIGRKRGKLFIERRPAIKGRVDRFKKLLNRYHTLVIVGFRFVYGIRTVAPIVIGASDIPASRFFILNAASAALWALIVSMAGYVFGQAMEILLDDIKHYEKWLIAAGVLMVITRYVYVYFTRLRRS